MDWKTLLAYITGSVDQELLLRNDCLVTENRLLRNQIQGRVRLTDGERKALAKRCAPQLETGVCCSGFASRSNASATLEPWHYL